MDESVVKNFEQPQVGTLKLSEAIRIGARLRPQCKGEMFSNGKSCALGAAYEGLYGHPGPAYSPHSQHTLLNRLRKDVAFPTGDPIRVIGMERNDKDQTREQIADWLQAQGY